MKKTLALVLALAMVFSTFTVVFAEDTLGEDAQICADLGMLKGPTGTVDAAYVATAPTRMQAAIMFLRLKGLEAEALAYTGEDNFADGKLAWAEGANLLAYLKANPQLGWQGDGTNFDPDGKITAQMYYKVLLEALGYKQSTAEVVGDFKWEEVLEFAAGKGLVKVAAVAEFTVNDLAVATVEALKITVKDGSKTLAATLVEAGKIDETKAVTAGLYVAAPVVIAAELKEAKATGNAVLEVKFKAAVDEAAENVDNYVIEGLAVNAAKISGTKTVILDTAAMTTGKLYKLTVGGKTVQFSGIAKVSGGPVIKSVEGTDIEEVVITFDKNVDLATASNEANYTIAGVDVVKAEIDRTKVTLTTEGLKNKTQYTVKTTNIKSADGVNKKSDSKSFKTNFDFTAPKISGTIVARTNERIIVPFNKKVTAESAEDITNYTIKIDVKDGEELGIVSATLDEDDENFVTIMTEPMEKNKTYKVTVNGLVDQTKSANKMAKDSSGTFKSKAPDETAPSFDAAEALSPTTILATFKDASDLDESSLVDIGNYTLGDLTVEDAEVLDDDYDSSNYVYRVIVTVEEMKTGTSYTLKASAILDEFGNEMKEKSKTVSTTGNAFASAKLNDPAVATGEQKILLTFDKEVDEDSAEDIANYTINNDIGNPTKATLKSGTAGRQVELEVNKLKNGKHANGDPLYKITANGVKDLAGNVLNYKVKVDTWTNTWDNDAPEIEGVDVLNKEVVTLSFDEKVQFAADAKLILAKAGVDTDTVAMDVKDISDDKTIVEFSAATPALQENVSYTVYRVVYGAGVDGGIRDLNGKPLYVNGIEFGKFVFTGKANNPDKVQVDSIDQVNGTTFEVLFSRNVVVSGPASKASANGKGSFTVTVDSDDEKLVTFVKDSEKIIKSTDYEFNLAAFVADKHGTEAENVDEPAKTLLTGNTTDEDAPIFDGIEAKNRETIIVTFDEDISAAAGAFTLVNVDLDNKIVSLKAVLPADIDENEVTLNLAALNILEARYEYKLTINMKKIKDMAGNAGTDDSYEVYFSGTNLAK